MQTIELRGYMIILLGITRSGHAMCKFHEDHYVRGVESFVLNRSIFNRLLHSNIADAVPGVLIEMPPKGTERSCHIFKTFKF